MDYREFGTTGIRVSEICYGTWRFASPDGTKNEQSEAGERALSAALDRGVNFIHSSHEYGTRWLTGSVLRDHPKRTEVHHIIKVNEPDFGEERFDKKKFREQIENALRELHTDRIAVVQHLQRGPISKKIVYTSEADETRKAGLSETGGELAEEADKLKQEGKIASLASFPYTVGFAKTAIASGIYDGLVAYFNLLETEWVDLFEDMRRRGMGFLGIRPLLAGLLTDKRIDRGQLGSDDRMAGEEWNERYAQLDRIRTETGINPESWTKYAIRFSLSHPIIATSTVSINNTKQLEDSLSAANGDYPTEDELFKVHAINKTFQEN